MNGSGDAYLTHTRLAGHLTARMAIGGTFTGRSHVDRAWEIIASSS